MIDCVALATASPVSGDVARGRKCGWWTSPSGSPVCLPITKLHCEMCAQMDAAVSRRKVCQTSISALQQNNNTIAVNNLLLIASRSINDTEEKLQCRMCLSDSLSSTDTFLAHCHLPECFPSYCFIVHLKHCTTLNNSVMQWMTTPNPLKKDRSRVTENHQSILVRSVLLNSTYHACTIHGGNDTFLIKY